MPSLGGHVNGAPHSDAPTEMNYLTLAFSALGAAAPALATQNINVDIGSPALGFGVPSSGIRCSS